MFLESNRRIQALVTVICLALLIFCLVERQLRRAIAPASTLDGLYVGQPAKPTGRLIFQALARPRLIPASGHDPPVIPQPPPLQARLLELLDVDPTQPLIQPRRTRCTPPTSTLHSSSCAKDPASRSASAAAPRRMLRLDPEEDCFAGAERDAAGVRFVLRAVGIGREDQCRV
jgi:hypothetical protein